MNLDEPGPLHDLICELMAVSDADAVCTCRSDDGHRESTAARLDRLCPVPCDGDVGGAA